MPKPKKGPRLGGSASHQAAILSNLAAQLFEHGAIKTTDAKARMLRPYAEKLITKAKKGTLADRRNALKLVPNKPVIAHLFNELAPKFEGREGGYTRIIKLENRKGDNAPMSQISLVLEVTDVQHHMEQLALPVPLRPGLPRRRPKRLLLLRTPQLTRPLQKKPPRRSNSYRLLGPAFYCK